MEDNTTASGNTAFGQQALRRNTTGTANVAVGFQALQDSTTALYNTAVGYVALTNNTTGQQNVAIGGDALDANTTGGENTAVGTSALGQNTTSDYNTAVGYAALTANTTGLSSTGIGALALYAQTTGQYNAAFGMKALEQVTTGVRNVAVGYDAGGNLTTGSYGIFIGMEANASGATTSEIMIGSATGRGNNTGYIYPPGGGGMYQASNLTTWSTVSDRRIKKNIQDNNIGLDAINQIQVRNFEYRTEEEIVDFDNPSSAVVNKEGIQLGVIAQEIETILPEIVTTESTGVKTVNTDNLTWYLVNAVKELSAQNAELTTRIEALEG
jgi:hypothetical protein